jgi:TRAP-type uncharacterized transport system substrate-binding protein
MKDGSLDAFFFTGGAPAGAIAELASAGAGIDILPIDGPQAEALRKSQRLLRPDTIAADTYKGVGAVQDPGRGRAVGHQRQGRCQHGLRDHQGAVQRRRAEALAAGHAKGKFITKENAVKGAGIPFHPGAEKFYKEAGLIK